MYILSNPAEDTRSPEQAPGGYEWWYFDAISADGRYSFVIIFYEGNPFSIRYITALEAPDTDSVMPEHYPAVSISVYENGTPIYYSFTEFGQADCRFDDERPFIKAGPHHMESQLENDGLKYILKLDEQLPSGDSLWAELTFLSGATKEFFAEEEITSEGHRWNLVQPRAEVEGEIRLSGGAKDNRAIDFSGTGYHDHNTGGEPLRDEFEDWYWGRFHFESATLIYYLMNGKESRQQRAWLFDSECGTPLERFGDIRLSDESWSLFGLTSAHRLQLDTEIAEIRVQQSTVIDNGPFYQRFLSEGFLHLPQKNVLESQVGFTEYIRPDRIYSRIFWPLINMRVRQADAKPHWVQRSKQLYRWTW